MISATKIFICGATSDRVTLPSSVPCTGIDELERALDGSDHGLDDPKPDSFILISCLPEHDYSTQLDQLTALAERIRAGIWNISLLVYFHDLQADEIVRCHRSGIFDLIARSEGEAQLHASLQRAKDQLQRKIDRLAVLADQKKAQMRLLESQKDLHAQIASTSSDLAVSNERLEMANEQLTVHMSQLSLLYSFGRELSNARNWDNALENLLENLAEFVGAGGAALFLRPAEDAPYTPRKTFHWQESAWEDTLNRIEKIQAEAQALGSQDNVFNIESQSAEAEDRVTALPLEHRGLCLGYLLLLRMPEENESEFLPLLNALQVILSEEVAAAQMLDRMRELSIFNSRVLETVRSGIWVIDELARTVYCNRVAREMISGDADPRVIEQIRAGYGRGRSNDGKTPMSEFFKRDESTDNEMPELFLDGLLSLNDTDGLPLRVMTAAGDEGWQGEGGIRAADGSLLPVLVQSSAMKGRTRSETWLVVVLEDQLESKRLAAEKLRSDKLQSLVEMSSTLAHEIRNPLMGLSAQAELLYENLPDDDPRRRYIDVITNEVERIDKTIGSMLDFTRPCTPMRQPMSLERMIEDCIVLAAPRAAKRSVEIQSRAAEHEAEIMADQGQLKQVILNLIFNAADASPEGGLVEIRSQSDTELTVTDPETGLQRNVQGARITVADDGRGFGDNNPEVIFRPFFTTKSAGTGLGLPVSRKIVEAHGGTLTAGRSNNQTVFTIQLPDVADQTPSITVEENR
jgi:signal transduction histidine kinase/PAS domain-containing protein